MSLAAQEYCENEAFRAACGVNEVIVMRSAQYGRMRLSKCIDRDYGYVGCSVDVLVHADRKCSGRRKCEIRVPDPDFSNDIDCPRDLKPYLEVGYDCVKGEFSLTSIQTKSGVMTLVNRKLTTDLPL